MYIDSDQLAALVAVVREGSFDRAARELHVTPSAVSQRIKQLEQHLGRVVVERSTPCKVTAGGEALYRHGLQVELLENDWLRSLGAGDAASATPSAPIALAVNADSLATFFVPALVQFAQQTGLQVEVMLDDQDHTAEWLRSGRVLGAVTAEAKPVHGCRVEGLGVMRYRATAKPAFIRRWFPSGVTAEALRRAPVLTFGRKDRLPWHFLRRVLGGRNVPLNAHLLPSDAALVEASLRGLGWGMNPEPLVGPHLKSRRLVDLIAGRWLDVPLFWQQWRLASHTLDTLTSTLKAQAAASLHPL